MQNNIITQSNDLLNASYVLTLNERRLLLACISQLDSRDDFNSTTPVNLSVNDAHDLFFDEQKAKDVFKQLVQASKQLKGRSVQLFNDSKTKERDTYWVQTIDIDYTKREINLYFAFGILPYLTQLKNNFTSYRLMNISRLTSVHAMRVYELVTQWSCQSSTAHYKEITVAEFKLLLGVDNKYGRINNLKSNVIDICVKQINESTDFELEIKLKKYTSSFDHIQFFYNKKSEPKAVKQIEPTQQIAPKVFTPQSSFSGLELVAFKALRKLHPTVTEAGIRALVERESSDAYVVMQRMIQKCSAPSEFNLSKD
jgi:plasmid replication initiation protein